MASIEDAENRPLSPHLMNWKWHVTMAASILHRATGVALYLGSFVVTAMIVSAAMGPDAYGVVEGLVFSIFGKLVMFGFTVAVIYHLLNGLRHMMWDGPRIGFSPNVASAWSWFNILAAVLGAAAVWAIGMFGAAS